MLVRKGLLILFIILLMSLTSCKSDSSTGPDNDTTNPMVEITNIENGASFVGSFTVNVQATDNVGVNLVSVYIDGSMYMSTTNPPYTFSVDCHDFMDGMHSLQAKASDDAGNVGSTNTITVNMTSDSAPTVAFMNLPNGTTISTQRNIDVTAIDNNSIVNVKLYLDNQQIGQDTSSPYSFSLNPFDFTDGTHTLQARATDNAGNIGYSENLSITINYDFAPNTNGRINVTISHYQELDPLDLTGYGDPYFVYEIEINNVVFDTYVSQTFSNTTVLNQNVSHIFDIPDNTREYKLTVWVYDEDTASDDLLDYTSVAGSAYYWNLNPISGDFTDTYNGNDDGLNDDKDCEITLSVDTLH
ncbi:MAG: hypothetical protein JXR56_04500 [Candidatus Cloacimonetes bacterium]|nr:hypothetical protein [Candidatus Cloacimonadota bacterium]